MAVGRARTGQAMNSAMKYTHDIPMAEMDGQHAKSIDCPCGTDVEEVTLGRTAIVYHQRRTPSKRWQR